MRADANQPHYAPASVGGLMDPAFLRIARHDADGASAVVEPQAPALWQRLQGVVQTVVAAIRHH